MKENYTVSIHYDRRLYKYDIVGSIVHARMLGKQGIIPNSEVATIVNGLEEIRVEIEDGNFPWRKDLEDIHMNIENRLFDKIGLTAGLLHTGRSRNDQISLDMRLYIKDVIPQILTLLHAMRLTLISQAESNSKVIMPGYTHLQRAQPVLFAHHMLAYYEMFARDNNRYQQTLDRSDVLPLGSGALAGVPIPTFPSIVESNVRANPTADSPMSLIIIPVRISVPSDGPKKRCDKCIVDVSPLASRAA